MIVKLLQKILFFVWMGSLIAATSLTLLLQQHLLKFSLANLQIIINANLASGILLVSIWTISLLFSLLKGFLIIIIAIAVVIFFLLKQNIFHPNWLPKINLKFASTIKITDGVKDYYNRLFFDIFGYPQDKNMTTADELLQVVNTYRTSKKLDALDEDSNLCDLAKSKMAEISTIRQKKVFDEVKTITDDKNFKKIGQITQGFVQKSSAKTIVNLRWSNFSFPQKKLMEDPDWDVACANVSGNTVVFLFGKK